MERWLGRVRGLDGKVVWEGEGARWKDGFGG